jgi:hypothetical protein
MTEPFAAGEESGAAALPAKLLCSLELTLASPLMLPGVPEGTRVIYSAVGGAFHGPRLTGEIVAQGGDWAILRGDGTVTLDVRITLRTADGALILVSATGRALRDGGAWQIRAALLFETGDRRYLWLNAAQGLGRGRKAGDTLALQVYELL